MTVNKIMCPVSENKVDENITRTAAFIVIIFITTGLLLKSYPLVFLITIDFAIRAFTSGKHSFVRLIAKSIAVFLKLNIIQTDASPKKFAAGLGVIFSLITGISLLIGNSVLAYISGSLLIFCAVLEGLFSFCLGCHIYSYINVLLNKHKFIKTN